MADPVDSPTPRDALVVGDDGALYFETFDATGHVQGEPTPISALDALVYLQNLIAFSISEVPDVPATRSDGTYDPNNVRTLPHADLVAQVRSLLDRMATDVQRENPAADSQTVRQILADQIKAAVLDPKAIRVVVEAIDNAAFVDRVWPDLTQVLAISGTDPNIEWPDAGGISRVIEGSSLLGPGGSPPTSQSVTLASGGGATSPSHAADPVLPFTGQFQVECVDLVIDGIGLDFELRRTYLHGARYFGPLGPRWDHSYNLWLREGVESERDGGYQYVVYRSTGTLRVERFQAEITAAPFATTDVSDAVFTAPDGSFDRLEKQGGRFVATTPNGLEILYDDNLRAETLVDTNNNRIRLLYDDVTEQLVSIIDTCGRVVRFEYDDSGLLIHVIDASLDRHVWYRYDEDGRLSAVWKSVARDEPPMLSTGYRYWGDGAPGDMAGNVVAVIDGRGVEVLQLAYGDEPGFIWYDRVIEQRDGGITRFEYEFVTDDDEEDRLNVAVIRCRMTSPSGDVQILDYNRMGRLVRLVVDDADPLNPPQLVTRWRYNADGMVIQESRVDGSTIEYVYEREIFESTHDPSEATADDRVSFGRLRRLVERARPGARGAPTRVTEFDYDPTFGQVTEKRGPYYGDVNGGRIDVGSAWSHRISPDAHGNVMSVTVPDCTLPDGTTQAGGRLTFSYDSYGRLIRRTVEAAPGRTIATGLRYAPAPDLAPVPILEIADPDGAALESSYVHDAAGRLVETQTHTGMRLIHALDHLGRLRREETWYPGRPQPTVKSFVFGSLPLPQRLEQNRLDESGLLEPMATLTEDFEFDADGDIASSHLYSADGAVDRTITYERDSSRRLAAYELGGVRYETLYNTRNQPVETRVTANGVASSTKRSRYDALGRLAVTIDESDRMTRYFYDGFGRLDRVLHASGTEEFFDWNARDALLGHRVVGAHPDSPAPVLLAEERQGHDEAGRVVSHTTMVFDPSKAVAPVEAKTTFTLDRADRIVVVTTPDGLQRTLQHDGLSRLVRVDDGAGTASTITFDDAANTVDEETVLSGMAPDGTPSTLSFHVRTEYDPKGRTQAVIDSLGNVWRWGYDSRGATRFEIDPAGIRTNFVVGADGQQDAVIEAAGRPEELRRTYRRDAMRRPIGIDGPRGALLDLTRDVFGRPASGRSGPESFTLSYRSDGHVESIRDGTGSVRTLGYDASGAITSVAVTPPAPGPASARAGAFAQLTFLRDGAGNLVTADDGVSAIQLRYDSRGLVRSERVGHLETLWSYDIAGRASTFQFPDGRRLHFNRNGDGRLHAILDAPPGVAAPIELLRVWALGACNFADQQWRGTTRRHEQLDRAGRLLAIDETRVADGGAILSLQQVADAVGNPRARRIAIGTVAESMITSTDAHGHIVSTQFDANGPIDVTGLGAGTATTQADLDTAIAIATGAFPPVAETIALGLDPDGARRTLTRNVGGAPVEQRLYSIDTLGRSTESGSGRTEDAEALPLTDRGTSCTYDAFRRLATVEDHGALVAGIGYDALGRITRITTPTQATTLLYAGNALVESRVGNRVLSQYVRFPGGPLIESGLPASPLRVFLDGQGSLLGMADLTGAVGATHLYDPFGEERATNGTWPDVGPGFQGMLAARGLNVLLTETRTYDPRCGAFRELDPAGAPDGMSRGLFACGNPLAYADPSGLMAQPADQSGQSSITPGVGGSYGDSMYARRRSDRPYNWAEHDILAIVGALASILEGFRQTALMLVDLVGVSHDIQLRSIGYDINYQARSGLGQMAAVDQVGPWLDVFRVIGRGLAETPGRLASALENDRPFDVGWEMMNIYMIARPAAVAGFNGGVSALRLGGFKGGLRLNAQIRQWQIRGMQSTAAQLGGAQNAPPVRVLYTSRLKGGAWGVYDENRQLIKISDNAFNPVHHLYRTVGAFFPGGYGGSIGSSLALRWGAVAGGNFALRTLSHEYFHHYQFTTAPASYRGSWNPTYILDPAEFTQSPHTAPWIGAWNAELAVPRGPLPIAAFMAVLTGENAANESGQ